MSFPTQFYSAQMRALHGISVLPCMTHIGVVAEMWKFAMLDVPSKCRPDPTIQMELLAWLLLQLMPSR
jgi:hypothetical protein